MSNVAFCVELAIRSSKIHLSFSSNTRMVHLNFEDLNNLILSVKRILYSASRNKIHIFIILFIICQEFGICVYYVININLSSVNYI